ncbi:MAG: DUF2726 domain-containing protein [Chloroflexi bacterium]|nr:MAG: DUF2726 domain-containing protein [Chloroflexota bacterium]
MEVIFLILLVFIIVFSVGLITPAKKHVESKKAYSYLKKKSIMTNTEAKFLLMLNNICGAKYYVVPQAHISIFLNHKIKGQSYRGAFSRINGKSVDFLLCTVDNSEPVIAIELDDLSHQRDDRVERDMFVEQILKESEMPLVRFKQGEWESEEQIYSKIKHTLIHE